MIHLEGSLDPDTLNKVVCFFQKSELFQYVLKGQFDILGKTNKVAMLTEGLINSLTTTTTQSHQTILVLTKKTK